ncbi:MAG: 50S ribosomal protein L20 [Bacilli bacterium]
MPRTKGGVVSRRRRKKVLKLAKGYFGSKHTLYRVANQQVMKSLSYAYRDRKRRKRDFRKLWITRINAGARINEMSYSQLMYGLKLANIEINRKMLSELAIYEPKAFSGLVKSAKKAIEKANK